MSNPVDVAARTAWAEARGEGAQGMQAVLNVIANRAKTPGWWGHDVLSVSKARWQFSCWNDGDPNQKKALAVTDEDPLFRAALTLAKRAVAGTLPDITGGADSYYALGTPRPRWATNRQPLKVIGHHAFYRIGLNGDGK